MKRPTPKNIDDYIAEFPKDVQKVLWQVHAAIKKAAPKAEEMISYGIPAFKLNGKPLIYYAGYKNHIGVYPIHGGDAAFQKLIAPYQKGKATARFPLDKAIPLTLLTKIVKFRIQVNKEKEKKK